MKNPKWLRQEIILALQLYFDCDRGTISSTNPKIIELSETLKNLKLPILKNDEQKFRNPNGISLKLSNFLAIDPDYLGEGMKGYSKLDEDIFFEFLNNKEGLKREAFKILKQIEEE